MHSLPISDFPHLRQLDRENLTIFKEIYQNKPVADVGPVVNLPQGPERHIGREEERHDTRREVETTRKLEAFKQKFADIAQTCDGKTISMGGGSVDHWLDQVKGASELYDTLYNAIPDATVINTCEVSVPGEGGGPRIIRRYTCHKELINWSTQLRDRKIELNEIRNPAKRHQKDRSQRERRFVKTRQHSDQADWREKLPILD